jgi:tRNA(fMet)-specific endonuclease VapC
MTISSAALSRSALLERESLALSRSALLERKYMLDTNIASHVIKGTQAVRNRLIEVPMHAISVSAVTEAELRYGVAKRAHPQKLRDLVKEFLIRVDVLPWTRAVAQVYADLRAACEAAGAPLGPLDMMIAAHAKAIGATLVTNDQAFSRIPAGSLALEDWTK